jgi:hypothetical protein
MRKRTGYIVTSGRNIERVVLSLRKAKKAYQKVLNPPPPKKARKSKYPKGALSIWSWVPKRIRLAVWWEKGDRLWSPGRKDHAKMCKGAWLAADLIGYHVSQGRTMAGAIESLILTLRVTEEEAAYDKRKGKKVIREHVERRAQDHIKEIEDQAKKTGMILEDVDWRNCHFSKYLNKLERRS